MIETPADYRSFAFYESKLQSVRTKCSGIRSFAFYTIFATSTQQHTQ